MGPAGRTTLEFLVLSDSLWPGVCDRDSDGSGRPRTLYFVHVVRNFVCVVHNFGRAFHNVTGVDRDFVCVLLNSVRGLRELFCGLRNVTYLARNGYICFGRIWVDNDSARSGKLDGWFSYLLCAPQSSCMSAL